MILTKEQQAILDGEKGETLAKVMKTLVMYGDAFEAEKLVPITSKYNHLVELLRRVHTYSAISVETIAYFLDCDFQKANEILNAFNSDLGDFSEFI